MRGRTVALVVAVALLHARGVAADPPRPADGGVPAVTVSAAADLSRLTLRELALEEALPLARHGYVFRTVWLARYFRAQPWYRPTGFDRRGLPADESVRADAAARYRASIPSAELWRRLEALRDRKRAARRACAIDVVAGGSRLVVQDLDGLVIWDVAAGRSIRIATNTKGLMGTPPPALSRDGARVLAVEAVETFGRKVSSWEAATGKPLGKPLLQTWDQSTVYLLSPDGASAFIHQLSDPRAGTLYGLDQGRALTALPVDALIVAAEQFVTSADRRRVLVLSGGRPWLWRSSAGAPTSLADSGDTAHDVDLSPDGRWVAVIGARARLVDADRPAKPKYLDAPYCNKCFVSFSPDGRLLMAGAADHSLTVWESPSARLLWKQPGRQPSLECARRWAAFLPGGTEVAMVDDGGGVTVVDVRSRAARAVTPPGLVADPDADDVEEALIDRALGRSPGGGHLDELSLQKQPDLLKQPLGDDDLERHVKAGEDLRQIEALIYARHGRRFASPRWRAFAAELTWYRADTKYTPKLLTSVDRANLALVTKRERQLEPRAPRGRPDSAAQVPRSAFPGCPAGTTRRQSTTEGVETISCTQPAAGGETASGPFWQWLPTGRLRSTRVFADRKEHGPSVTWYWTGVRKEEGEMVGGQRHGRWRAYHPNGKLADESSYDAGKLHGPRRRFFASGKPALEATYHEGVPVGAWTAYYDNGRRALAVTFPAAAVAGFRPDGKPWPAGAKIQTCEGQPACKSALERMDLDSLPPVIPEPTCPRAGKLPRASWKPVLGAARRAWAGEGDYTPHCVREITVRCAPDLDAAAGAEVLAEIEYRILIGGARDCETKDSNGVWEMTGLVALSPPGPGRTDWTARGLIGYPHFTADNGGTETSVLRFVRLPSGETALHTSLYSDPGDCGPGTDESIVVLRDGKWAHVAGRTIHACSRPDEPEEWDVF